jgi:hypothetical protein
VSSDEKVFDFPKAEITSAEKVRRAMAEAKRLARLAPGEWRLWIDRAAAVRLLPHWEEIDAWRSSMPQTRQAALNNPRETWAAYLEHRRKLGDPEARDRPTGRKHRQFPSLLEQMEALAEQLEMANERAERAERESEYFAAMMQEVAKRADLDEDAIAEIRAKVRAAHEGEEDPHEAGDQQPDSGGA